VTFAQEPTNLTKVSKGGYKVLKICGEYIMKKLTLLTLTLGLAAGSAQASVIGTQGFADIGTPTADDGSTGDINTAAAFTIGDLVSTSSNTGDFAGLPSQVFGGQLQYRRRHQSYLRQQCFWHVHQR
jgi:hypothetical protein